jgi:hypothetical protein
MKTDQYHNIVKGEKIFYDKNHKNVLRYRISLKYLSLHFAVISIAPHLGSFFIFKFERKNTTLPYM